MMIKNAAKIVCYLFDKPKRQKNPRNVFKKSNSTRADYTVKKKEKNSALYWKIPLHTTENSLCS